MHGQRPIEMNPSPAPNGGSRAFPGYYRCAAAWIRCLPRQGRRPGGASC